MMRPIHITTTITERKGEVEKYLQEISRVPLLTAEEEASLGHRIQQGDEEALEKLVKANLRFVVSVAKQYQGQGLSLADLINEGNIGLIKAAQRFDPTRGFKFISYAVWWIRQDILQALSDLGRTVRVPQNQTDLIRKISHFSQQFVQENQRQPSAEEIAAALNEELPRIQQALQASGRSVSIDAPLVEDEEGCLLDMLFNEEPNEAESNLVNESLKAEVKRALSELSPRENKVIRLFFGLDGPAMSLDDIGMELHLSRERVRQIKDKAIRMLRNAHESSVLRSFL